MLAALGRLGAGAGDALARAESSRCSRRCCRRPASRSCAASFPGLTGGEGVLESEFAGYQPVTGEPPIRKRATPDPRNLDEYLARVGR